ECRGAAPGTLSAKAPAVEGRGRPALRKAGQGSFGGGRQETHGGGRVSETFRPGEGHEVEEVARLVAHSFPGPGRTHAGWLDYLTAGPHGGVEALWVGEEG